jgi:predicted amidohydrolase YtcJ
MEPSVRTVLAPGLLAAAVLGLALSARTLAGAPAQAVQPVDLVITNGKVVTVVDGAPEAQAVASAGGRIVAVGTNAEIQKYVGPKTEVIDVKGQLVIPGFIEGHGHFSGVGTARLNLNLMNAKTWDEIVAMVAERVKTAKPGEWIYGRGWHQEKWDVTPSPEVEGFPVHHSLSKVSPNNPVLLTHASGHASFANARAMELSGVTGKTPNPSGGDFLKDGQGNPTGLFRETASRLIRTGTGENPTPEERAARARRILELASEEVSSASRAGGSSRATPPRSTTTSSACR